MLVVSSPFQILTRVNAAKRLTKAVTVFVGRLTGGNAGQTDFSLEKGKESSANER